MISYFNLFLLNNRRIEIYVNYQSFIIKYQRISFHFEVSQLSDSRIPWDPTTCVFDYSAVFLIIHHFSSLTKVNGHQKAYF